jgi:RHS repeat-associated protein
MRGWLRLLPFVLLWPASGWAQIVEYYHLDGVGNVLAVTNSSGVVVEQHDYLPFGQEWCGTAICGAVTAGQPKRFTGKERDAETGLDYFGARYYGSKIGRFTTVDPVLNAKDALINPQKWNRYAYVSNNPLRYVDPDGREQTVVIGGKTYMGGVDGMSAGNERAKNMVFGALVGGTLLGAGAVVGVTEALAASGAAATAGGGGSVLLGETMRRVAPVAQQLEAKTFQTTWTNSADVLAKNLGWLKDQIAAGARVYDIGLDVARNAGSRFYSAEVNLLQEAGYVRRYVSQVTASGTTERLYQWVKPVGEKAVK